MWDLIVSVPDHCLSFYTTFYEKTLNHKSKPSTSTSSAFNSKYPHLSGNLAKKKKKKKKSKKQKKTKQKKQKKKQQHCIQSLFCFVLFPNITSIF